MSPPFDPYYEWLGIAPKDQPPNAYRLLGIDLFESNAKAIEAAVEARTHVLRTRQNGPHGDATQKILNEVHRVRVILLDPEQKKRYDAELRAKLDAASAAAISDLPRAQPLADVPVKSPSTVPGPANKPASGLPIMEIAIAGVLLAIIGVAAVVYFNRGGDPKKPLAEKPPEKPVVKPVEKPVNPPISKPPFFPKPVDPPPEKQPSTNPVASIGLPPTAGKIVPEIYLDDIDEDFAHVHYGSFGRHGEMHVKMPRAPRRVIWKGQPVDHALHTTAVFAGNIPRPTFVHYDIGGAYTQFSGTVGLNDVPKWLDRETAALFRIVGDGRVLWNSAPQATKGEGEDFRVDVSGVRQLRLEVAPQSGNDTGVDAVWIAPKLSGGTKPLVSRRERLSGPRLVYLDDLPGLDFHVGYGLVGRFGATTFNYNEQPILRFQQARVWHGVAMHPEPARATFQTSGQFRSFRATVGLNEAEPTIGPGFQGIIVFRVEGDGRTLWESKPISTRGEVDQCQIDVSGVQALTLSAEASGPKMADYAHASWFYPQLEWAAGFPPRPTGPTITADEVVISNTHNVPHFDRGARFINVLLYHDDTLVSHLPAIRIGWSTLEEPSVRVPLPKVGFNRLRVECVDNATNIGGGLCEIEVMQGSTNLAAKSIATASSSYPSEANDRQVAPQGVIDGVRTSESNSHRPWLLNNTQHGWIELEWRAPPKNSKPHPVLGYTLQRHPRSAVSFQGHYYVFFAGRIEWDDAQRRCQEMGGYLACVTSEEEAEFLWRLSRTTTSLGGKRIANRWEWVNGEPWNYSRWKPGEPNNTGGHEDRLEHFPGGWNDTDHATTLNRGYICEWEE